MYPRYLNRINKLFTTIALSIVGHTRAGGLNFETEVVYTLTTSRWL